MSGDVLLFGKLRDVFGGDRIALPPAVETVEDLRGRLAELHPEQADVIAAPSVRVAVNQELILDEAATRISSEDEIALLPPLSGG